MKLKVRLTLAICGLMAVVIAALSGVLLSQARKLQIEMAMKNLQSGAGMHAEKIEEHYMNYRDSALMMAQLMGDYQNVEVELRRTRFISQLRAVFEQNPQFAGVYAVWKPGVLDGLDDRYRNARGCDENGNFIPYFTRVSGKTGEIEFSAMPDHRNILNNLSTREEISRPREWIIDGETRFTVHFRLPITGANRTLVGVVGVVADLNYSAELISRIKPYDAGRAELYTTDGIIVASHDEAVVGRNFQEAKRDRFGPEGIRIIEQALQKGEPALVKNAGLLVQGYPFRIGNADGFWMLVESVPMNVVLKDVNAMTGFSVIIATVSILLALAAGLFTAYRLSVPIVGVSNTLKDISEGEGDLTRSITVTRTDEIGDLAGYFNRTLEKIRNLIITIKRQSAGLSEIGSELSTSMTETAAAVNEITANIQSIKSRVISQSASVTETHSTMEQITVNIGRLNTYIEKQAAGVAKSSAAIEEMIANIQSVTRTLVKNADNVKKLADASELGRSSLRAVAADIQEIARESEGLVEINSVMETIAGQTNLLSMNAAIEAAHAGESGKGFAVVAGEIRSLAESAGERLRTISEVLKKIRVSIDKITKSTGSALNKFEAIDSGVKIVAEQEEHIRGAMEEQSAGSRQVMEAMAQLNEITQQVKEGSQEMLEGSREVIQESKNLEMVTAEISGGMNEMAAGADQINTAVNEVNTISGRNKESIDILVNEVSRFKVE